ncbi:MAG: hypothetical protein IKZ19_01160, partial [Clostridia bacterium]|nr:hypothetical protein [Clostridia bacterium]
MKKFIAIFLALCLCLGLSACSLGDLQSGIGNSDGEMNSANNFGGLLGGLGKEKPEEKYAELLEMLENEEYENAIVYIMMLSESGYVEIDPDGTIIATMPVEGSDAVEISNEVRWTYDSITYGLDNYAENGYFSYYDDIQDTSFSDNEGLANAYAFLQEYSYYESAEEYLARFSV